MIRQADTDQEIAACCAVMRQLRPHVPADTFVARVRALMQDGFSLCYAMHGERVVAVAGFRVSTNLFLGKHLYVDDLVTDEAARSQGHGARLMAWLEDYARRAGCAALHLDSGVQRFGAHKFYLNQGMRIASYHFLKDLNQPPTA